jgi:hypothetical protein
MKFADQAGERIASEGGTANPPYRDQAALSPARSASRSTKERSLMNARWYGKCAKHGRYLWHPHGKRCPVCGQR